MNLRFVRLACVVVALSCLASSAFVEAPAQQPEAAQNAGSIFGRVTVDGKPKAGLVVELLANDKGRRRLIGKATTNKVGKYLLSRVGSGTYDVSPSSPTLVVPNLGNWGQSSKSVTIEPGERVRGIDFDLISQGSIRGRVRDVAGQPVKGQTVELILRGEDDYSRPSYSSEPGKITV